MQPLYMTRLGAFGDHLVSSSVFPFLLQQHSPVYLEVNYQGMSLFGGDPRFDFVTFFETHSRDEFDAKRDCLKRWAFLKKHCHVNGWRFINFWNTMENTALLCEDDPQATLPREERAKYFCKNFYEQVFSKAEVVIPDGWMHTNTLYFHGSEIDICEKWKAMNADDFVMMVAIGGSSRQKVFPTWMQSYCKRLIDTYPKLKIYLMGGPELANDVWEYERTFSYVTGTGSNVGIKQAILMTKYSDYVLGGETGLMIGAGMMGTPKTILWTIANMNQLVNYHVNDYSLQSKAPCSPCHVMAYSGEGCEKEPVYNAFPICVHEFDQDELINIFDKLYTARF